MATTLDVPSTRILDSTETYTERLATIINTIAKTEKIMLMSGPGVSVACGLPCLDMDERVLLGSTDFQYETSLQNAFDECSLLNTQAKSVSQNRLALFNKYMADLRVRARSAPMSNFHLFLQRALREKRVMRCLTTSFDGLDGQPNSGDDERIIRMYGDNRFLRCFDGNRELPVMHERRLTDVAQGMKSQRLAGQSAALRFLRPAVDIHLPIELHRVGDLRNEVIEDAKSCQLLLIVGLTLKSGEVYDLVRELASEVHHGYGAVIYVDNEPIRGRNTGGIVDFHLQMDIEEFSTRVLAAMDTLQMAADDINMDPVLELEQSEMWYEVRDTRIVKLR
ncbi:unnamed protein product [Rhizoctonia solani]|uniref:Deacetylase sirtuin-type domain-containing protein n=1 Tax=Rhizoctonia solani TaxID=456999 RepID=A0A8H3DEV5_9AGAM|nr:unnamed protein product [Rhizoctonia solani]